MGLLLNAASFQVQKGLLAPALCLPLVLIRRWRPLPSYHRTVKTALQLDTLTLASRLQLLPAPAERPASLARSRSCRATLTVYTHQAAPAQWAETAFTLALAHRTPANIAPDEHATCAA